MEASNLTYVVQRVEEPGSARALISAKTTNFLIPFMLAEHSTASAAKELKVRLNTMAYWVGRLQQMGLVQPTCLKKRGGRAVQHYRASADAFFVPFARMGAASLEDIFGQLMQPFERAFTQSLVALLAEPGTDWGVCLSAPGGRPTYVIADERGNRPLNSRQPASSAATNRWQRLQLDFADAKSLQQELLELLDRYGDKKGSQGYIVHLASVPLKAGL